MTTLLHNFTGGSPVPATLTGPGGPLHQIANRAMDTIVVHCTATPEGRAVPLATVRGWHLKNGWSDIGYHYYIHLDGSIETGRPLNRTGAHVAGHNTGSIGIVYVGGLDASGGAKDTRTAAQKTALRALIADLVGQYGITSIVGHRDLSPDLDGDGEIEPFEWIKQCPCFDAVPEYADLLSAGATGKDDLELGLRVGSSGPAVSELQKLLGMLPTGQFDAATATAVVAAKRRIGLYPSAIVLPYVMDMLRQA